MPVVGRLGSEGVGSSGAAGHCARGSGAGWLRTFGAGYLTYQLYWLAMRRGPSPEWSVLEISLVLGGCAVAVSSVYAAAGHGLAGLWPRTLVGLAGIAGGALGVPVCMLLWPLFAGPFYVGWAGMAWAAAGLALVPHRAPGYVRVVVAAIASAAGLVWILAVLPGLPDRAFEYETYGLTSACVTAMLLVSAAASHKACSLLCARG